MEPLTPNDPLWKVLGQSRRVEPRPNFTQNVVRLARQTPQERGWLARVRGWWQEREGLSAPAGFAWAGMAAAVLVSALWVGGMMQDGSPQNAPAVAVISAPVPEAEVPPVPAAPETDFPLMPEFATEWQNLEQMGDLLAVHDASAFTDSEIGMLLY